ncbi:aldo/keto reductase [Candidatus Villigracilis saccharophilus]|uniref:aldo/keto reductase n=1 Tax=Candidatus Villigracilis saccharophilus TaxID=3140684 RepID=UPI0031374B74|nr:aldo/keto reductase [Anaerolineales bacterium]
MIPTLTFGCTGHQSTRTIFGAAAFWETPQKEVDATMDLILQNGINHVDTAASYGLAEQVLGDWIRRHGKQFFLATKTDQRTKQTAYDQIRRSLDLLHVDQVDMIQIHALHEEPDWSTAFGPDGVIEAVIQARDEGLARFIGVTGHGVPVPEFHLRSLAQFDFDAVLLPYSFMMMQNQRYAENFNKVLAICKNRNIAVQTIKGITRSPWNDVQQNHTTWYRPLEDQADIDLAMHWVLGNPQVFLNTAGDINLLPSILASAHRFESRPTERQMLDLGERLKMEPLFK